MSDDVKYFDTIAMTMIFIGGFISLYLAYFWFKNINKFLVSQIVNMLIFILALLPFALAVFVFQQSSTILAILLSIAGIVGVAAYVRHSPDNSIK